VAEKGSHGITSQSSLLAITNPDIPYIIPAAKANHNSFSKLSVSIFFSFRLLRFDQQTSFLQNIEQWIVPFYAVINHLAPNFVSRDATLDREPMANVAKLPFEQSRLRFPAWLFKNVISK